MAFNFLKHTWQKIVFCIVIVLTVLILIGAIFVNRYWSPILADKLRSTVLKSTDSLYNVKFDDAQLHVLQGKIVLYNITLTPDTAVFKAKVKSGDAPKGLYTLRVKKLILKHIHPFRLYFSHKLDIGQIVVRSPEVIIDAYPQNQKDKKPKEKKTIYQQISKSLKELSVDQINFSGVSLKYINHKTAKPAVSEFKELDLAAFNLLIDSATQFDRSRFLYCREVTFDLNNYTGHSANKLYSYQAKLVKFSTRTRKLEAFNCVFRAAKPPFAFFSKTFKDRFTAHLDTLQLTNFDFETYNLTQYVKASNLLLKNGGLNVYGNPRLNPSEMKDDRFPTFPNKAIHSIRLKFRLDTLEIRNVAVRYEEFNRSTMRAGHVDFVHVRGHFLNITNDTALLQKNRYCNAALKSRFMDKGDLYVNFKFNLLDKNGAFSYNGFLGPFNMPAANPAAIPLGSMAIRAGQVKRINFDFNADRYFVKGNVTFLYNNLKIQILKADTGERKMKHRPLATLFANAVIIKHNNPDGPDQIPRTANILFKRPSFFPFFKTIWHGMFVGLKTCAGVDEKAQKQADNKLAEQEEKKLDKQSKKQKRQARRAERKRKRALKKRQKELEKQQEKAAENQKS
ncbi:hypothetical protein MUY27_13280 [Mucilaginibacter sp. RS28]|uniref:Uncharacterized protein n=1 Tax=Mucilaginibacter straminoryzae TaxID=2932774 RepID=A0A9X1X498_9SPHI|nr:hypothetical protein [Mucilaginibacter straminoryzae]MCJ8210683.1 hypothetical protein [Mucilaginibacter straminoryzae]